ncbi:MAG: sigma-70 family RNA polymerase sigma factor [Clostridia bacterium]|nr:sigma-70 family RNA polymerase sigma factor [Clostridia bacterium]
MEDARIIDLYFARDEAAIAETGRRYGRYLTTVARNILRNEQEAEECVNDTYLRAWEAIPPHRPARLAAFLGKITRRLALDRYASLTAQKRGGGQTEELLEEWKDCLPQTDGRRYADDLALKDAFNRFLRSLPADKRRLFVRRYWYAAPISALARELGQKESSIKMQLMRLRQQLRDFLEKEDMQYE